MSGVESASKSGDLTRRFNVFVSYSRDDAAFVSALQSGLEFEGGFDVWVDQDSIHEGENWKQRLSDLIAEADSIVFVMTPGSLASPVVLWELDEAKRLSKRVIPVLAAPINDLAPPEHISALNYVRFDTLDFANPASFITGLTALRRALLTDLGWLREHTRLLNLALGWDQAGRPQSRLLIGADVEDAKIWLAGKPGAAPPPTGIHREFISASDVAETERTSSERKRTERLQRLVLQMRWALGGIVALALAAAGAGTYVWLARNEADRQRMELAATTERLDRTTYEVQVQTTRADTEGTRADRFAEYAVLRLKIDSCTHEDEWEELEAAAKTISQDINLEEYIDDDLLFSLETQKTAERDLQLCDRIVSLQSSIAEATQPEASTPAPSDAATAKPDTALERFRAFAGESIADAPDLLAAINAAADRYGISDNKLRYAHFMAQIAHESGNFRHREENLAYSADALMRVFPKYFPSEQDAQQFQRKPELIANRVYANRMGNGDEASGDGYRYRGRGLIQLAGRDNYRTISQRIGVDIEADPDLLANDYRVSALAAAALWDARSLNQLADQDDLRGVTRALVGGYVGLANREALLQRAKATWPN